MISKHWRVYFKKSERQRREKKVNKQKTGKNVIVDKEKETDRKKSGEVC